MKRGLGLIDPRPTVPTVPFHETQVGSFLINRSGAIIGGLIGGPIGALVGEGVQQVITACVSRRESARSIGIDFDGQATYPLTATEQTYFENWLDAQAIPTFQGLLNDVDNAIAEHDTVNDTVIEKINNVLADLGVLMAYKDALVQSADSMRLSKSFIMNKVSILEFGINTIEKAIMDYLNEKGTDYKAVYEEIEASTVVRVGTMPLNWIGTQTGQSIKYILKSEIPNSNQTDVTDVVSGGNSGNSNSGNTTNTGSENVVTETKKMNPIVRYMLLMGAGYFFSKAINK